MSFEIFIGIAILVLVFIMFFTNIGGDYTKRTDQQLLDLWSLHETNVRSAKEVGPEAHKKALVKMATLTNEMKKRGLLKSDFTQNNEVLDSMSRKLFSRSLDEIKSLAKSNDAKALYQLGAIFYAVKEMDTSIQYTSDSANLGYADAQYALGWAFMTEGSGVTRSVCETMKWFKIAAEQGHVEARKTLDVVLNSSSKDEADTAFAEAEKWLASKGGIAVNKPEQLAKNGDHQAQVRLFLKAADQENADAQRNLGVHMKDNATENETWTLAILTFVHLPMVALKVGRYPVAKIINQFPVNEREKIKEGIDAVEKLGFFVIDGNDIQLTDKGETLFEMLPQLCQLSADERLELVKASPRVASLLTAIERDSRLSPPLGLGR